MKRDVFFVLSVVLLTAFAGAAPLGAEEGAILPADELWEDVVIEALDRVAGGAGQWVLKGKNEATGYGSDYSVSSTTQVLEGANAVGANALSVGNKVHVIYEYDADYRRIAKKIEKLGAPPT